MSPKGEDTRPGIFIRKEGCVLGSRGVGVSICFVFSLFAVFPGCRSGYNIRDWLYFQKRGGGFFQGKRTIFSLFLLSLRPVISESGLHGSFLSPGFRWKQHLSGTAGENKWKGEQNFVRLSWGVFLYFDLFFIKMCLCLRELGIPVFCIV